MDLWIRSQDKERLLKPIDFYIGETIDYTNKTSEFDIYGLSLTNEDIRLGTYKTKERALEILDEIQDILNHKKIFICNKEKSFESFLESGGMVIQPYDYKCEIQQFETYVYEMPQE